MRFDSFVCYDLRRCWYCINFSRKLCFWEMTAGEILTAVIFHIQQNLIFLWLEDFEDFKFWWDFWLLKWRKRHLVKISLSKFYCKGNSCFLEPKQTAQWFSGLEGAHVWFFLRAQMTLPQRDHTSALVFFQINLNIQFKTHVEEAITYFKQKNCC